MQGENTMSYWRRWTVVSAYAVAMAWVEAAVVFYLRTYIDRIEPYQAIPLPDMGHLGAVELVREAATLVMLFTMGCLAGTTWRSRVGYMALAFGVWDIFYYVFLKVMTGWPASLADWDVLFLLPLPWWGPVWAPVSISILMILWGTLVTRDPDAPRLPGSRWAAGALGGLGIALALYVFMADAIEIADQGADALRAMLPEEFNSPLFFVALVLMAAPVVDAGLWRRLSGKQPTGFEAVRSIADDETGLKKF